MSTHSFPRSLAGRVVLAQLLGVGMATACAAMIARFTGASAEYLAKTALASGVVGTIVLRSVGRGHPFDRFGPANLVTTGRASLVAACAALIGEGPSPPVATAAAGTALAVTALDGLDGWLARSTRMESAFGARFDMEVDALLIAVLAVIAWTHGKAGSWIVLAGAMRYGFVVAGWIWRWLAAPLPSSRRRKAICIVQIVGLAAVVSPWLPASVTVGVAWLTLVALVWSFAVDTLWLRRHSA